MKIRLTFKTPDAVEDALDQIEDENQRDAAEQVCNKFFEYGEYVYIEVDTVAGTATVVPV